MQYLIKLLISVAIIIVCTQIGRRVPSLAGLIATMPLTSLIVLVWLYTDNPGDFTLMASFARGALWGIIPSILFFISVYLCFTRHFPFAVVLSISFGIWLIGAFFHQRLLG
jgi:F0F1-type ATP synthase assembly protein I